MQKEEKIRIAWTAAALIAGAAIPYLVSTAHAQAHGTETRVADLPQWLPNAGDDEGYARIEKVNRQFGTCSDSSRDDHTSTVPLKKTPQPAQCG